MIKRNQIKSKALSHKTGFSAVLLPGMAFALEGCGSGIPFSNSNKVVEISGAAVKGPLSNALAFVDLDGDGVKDANEPSALTDANGLFSITASENGKIVVTNDPSGTTTDTSTGLALANFTLSAPEGAGVVSPMTTLMAEGGMTAEQLVQGLGLPAGVDPLTFNPFATGADATNALAVEKLSHQVFNIVSTYADSAVTVGTNVDAGAAFKAAMQAVADTAKTRASTGEVLDLALSDDLTAIQSAAVTKFAAVGTMPNTFATYLDSVSAGLKNVNAQIANADSLTSDAAKDLFKLGASLREQVNTGAQAEKAAPGTGANSVAYKSSAAVTEAAGDAAVKVVEVSGKVLIGPVKSALVWLDKDGDGVLDSNEKSKRTDEDGSFTFSTTSSAPNYAVLLDDSSINMAAGNVVGDQFGVPLYSAGGNIVSHITTVMKKAGLTSAQVNSIFDLPDISDIANFDPYGEGVSASQATAYLQATHQMAAVFDQMVAVAVGGGAPTSTAWAKTLDAIASVAENAEAGSFVFDGNSAKANIEALLNAVATEANVQGKLTSTLKDAVVEATYNLTTVIGKVDDFDPETADGIGKLSNANSLQFQIVNAITAGDPNKITYKTASNLEDDLTNRPPTDVGFLVDNELVDFVLIKDNATTAQKTFDVGVVDDGSLRRWDIAEIDGTDYASFIFADAADTDNPRMLYASEDSTLSSIKLKLNVTSLDAAVKNTYSLVLTAQDDAYKDYSEPLLVVVSEAL